MLSRISNRYELAFVNYRLIFFEGVKEIAMHDIYPRVVLLMLSGLLSIWRIINHIGATERKPQLMDSAEANYRRPMRSEIMLK